MDIAAYIYQVHTVGINEIALLDAFEKYLGFDPNHLLDKFGGQNRVEAENSFINEEEYDRKSFIVTRGSRNKEKDKRFGFESLRLVDLREIGNWKQEDFDLRIEETLLYHPHKIDFTNWIFPFRVIPLKIKSEERNSVVFKDMKIDTLSDLLKSICGK